MTEHTPGPWVVREGRNETEFFVQAPRLDPSHPYDIEIMGEDHGHELYPTEVRRADADLIAAAPDLLAALKALRKEVADMLAPVDRLAAANDRLEQQPVIVNADAAINRAEGKS